MQSMTYKLYLSKNKAQVWQEGWIAKTFITHLLTDAALIVIQLNVHGKVINSQRHKYIIKV